MKALEKAIGLALRIHEGQTDRFGQPYILHPLHVMLQMDTEDEMIAAVLHDVVEDSNTTLDDLRADGFPESAVEGVRLVTREEGVPYQEYVRRLKPNPIARKIKLADLQHNMDVRRMDEVTPEDCQRLERYRKAWETLTSG